MRCQRQAAIPRHGQQLRPGLQVVGGADFHRGCRVRVVEVCRDSRAAAVDARYAAPWHTAGRSARATRSQQRPTAVNVLAQGVPDAVVGREDVGRVTVRHLCGCRRAPQDRRAATRPPQADIALEGLRAAAEVRLPEWLRYDHVASGIQQVRACTSTSISTRVSARTLANPIARRAYSSTRLVPLFAIQKATYGVLRGTKDGQMKRLETM